jgi:hypothetical protein
MSVIRDIRLELKTGEVLRREGFRGYASARSGIKSQITELLQGVRREHLLEPVAACEIYAIVGVSPDRVSLGGGAAVNGSLLPSTFPDARELAIAVSTIGPGLERQVTAYTQGGETLRGMLLDGIGSAAVDKLAIEVCRRIAKEASSRGFQAGSPVSPGMPGLPITEQGNILEMVHAGEIGVSLTSAGVMVPRKSTSLIVALGPKMATWSQAEVCARCNLRETCPYCVLVD